MDMPPAKSCAKADWSAAFKAVSRSLAALIWPTCSSRCFSNASCCCLYADSVCNRACCNWLSRWKVISRAWASICARCGSAWMLWWDSLVCAPICTPRAYSAPMSVLGNQLVGDNGMSVISVVRVVVVIAARIVILFVRKFVVGGRREFLPGRAVVHVTGDGGLILVLYLLRDAGRVAIVYLAADAGTAARGCGCDRRGGTVRTVIRGGRRGVESDLRHAETGRTAARADSSRRGFQA